MTKRNAMGIYFLLEEFKKKKTTKKKGFQEGTKYKKGPDAYPEVLDWVRKR